MKKTTFPILRSILDTDAYKIHMQQVIFFKYNTVHVVSKFICRDNNRLGRYKNILIEQIQMMSNISLTHEEYVYLLSFPYFKLEYLNWLKDFRFNVSQVKINNYRNELHIIVTGLWKEVILWEVPILSLVSEIVNRDRYPHVDEIVATNYLNRKLLDFYQQYQNIDLLKLKIIDFGTRRRFSYNVHMSVIYQLKKKLTCFSGTSNYHFARMFDLTPVGTQSHEWFQAHQQISPILSDSQKLALYVWVNFYHDYLNIALTDCITMDVFLQDFQYQLARKYKGIRHDSGDPVIWGEKAIHHYRKLGIDPLKKILLFSDNLNFKKIIYLYKRFLNRSQLVFGLGTNLTCDIPNVKALNIVLKLVLCNDKPVAKISDCLGKTFCLDESYITSLKQAYNLC
ncbi:MAG: nicotinate phosphoribosyltransferase [Buchnera aphidicola (Eriosoma harunire)]